MSDFRVCVLSAAYDDVKKLEYEVFVRAGYIEPNEHEEVLENGKYCDSRFLVVVDEARKRVAGSLRVVLDKDSSINELSIPALSSFEIWPWMRRQIKRLSQDKVAQIGTMVIHESARGGKVLGMLIRKLVELYFQEGFRYGVSTIDERFYKVLVAKGYPIRQIGDKKFYMGSYTVPVMFDALELSEAHRPAAALAVSMAS